MKHFTAIAAATLLMAGASQADEFAPAMQSYLESSLVGWINDPILVDAIMKQNSETAALAQADIDALDQAWRGEVGTLETPTIAPVLENPAADFLRQQVAASDGVITEVFAMDARGLNVAASDVTSDYWQGDEAKHAETFGAGPNAVHLGDVEFDDSTGTFQGQISVSITDPQTGIAIGAITVGVNAESLM